MFVDSSLIKLEDNGLVDISLAVKDSVNIVKNYISSSKIKPKLAIVYINDDNNEQYSTINEMKTIMEYMGVEVQLYIFGPLIEEVLIIPHIKDLNSQYNGIILTGATTICYDIDKLRNYIDPDKRIDGLGDDNIGKIIRNNLNSYTCPEVRIIFGLLSKLTCMESINLCKESKILIISDKDDKNIAMKLLAAEFANAEYSYTYYNYYDSEENNDLINLIEDSHIVIVSCKNPKLINHIYVANSTTIYDDRRFNTFDKLLIDCGTVTVGCNTYGNVDGKLIAKYINNNKMDGENRIRYTESIYKYPELFAAALTNNLIQAYHNQNKDD